MVYQLRNFLRNLPKDKNLGRKLYLATVPQTPLISLLTYHNFSTKFFKGQSNCYIVILPYCCATRKIVKQYSNITVEFWRNSN